MKQLNIYFFKNCLPSTKLPGSCEVEPSAVSPYGAHMMSNFAERQLTSEMTCQSDLSYLSVLETALNMMSYFSTPT